MKYNTNYLRTHDIDWFCIINGLYVHVASAGGIIPEALRDREELRQLQHIVSNAPFLFSENEIVYNERFLNSRFHDGESREDYVRSFRDMARKGFVSMDRTDWINPQSNDYHVVCCPNRNLKPIIPEGVVLKNSCIIQIEALELNSETKGVKLLNFFPTNNR